MAVQIKYDRGAHHASHYICIKVEITVRQVHKASNRYDKYAVLDPMLV